MIAKRLAALLLAVGLVVGAVLIRGALENGDDSTATNIAANGPNTPASSATQLVCITELMQVCNTIGRQHNDLSVTVEPAGRTLDRLGRLANDDVGTAPLWLTIDPYPAMVDVLRQRAGLRPIDWGAEPVGASPLAIAMPAGGRADVLDTALASGGQCDAATLWNCIGRHAGSAWTDLGGESSWQTMRPAFGDVPSSALALASFAGAVGGYFESASFDRGRWEADSGFVTWLRPLVRAAARTPLSGTSALSTMATRASALDVAATSAFELEAMGTSSSRVEVRYPEPTMMIHAVIAAPAGATAPTSVTDSTVAALASAGWQPANATDVGLPGAATMLDLRSLWQDAT